MKIMCRDLKTDEVYEGHPLKVKADISSAFAVSDEVAQKMLDATDPNHTITLYSKNYELWKERQKRS